MSEYLKIRIGKTNTYLLQSEFNFYILIDTPTASGAKKLKHRISRLGVRPSQIKLIIVTHSHYDHVGSLAEIVRWTGAKVVCHEYAAEFLQAGNTPSPVCISSIVQKGLDFSEKHFSQFFRFPTVTPDITFLDNYSLKEWGIAGSLIHTPGHTIDSISLITDFNTAFVGDTLFNILPGTINPPFQEDKEMLLQSWKKLSAANPQILLPGHGLPIAVHRLVKAIKKASMEAL